MFNKKQKEIDRLNIKCIELARLLRDSNFENKELKKIREEDVKNNKKQNQLLSEIYKITVQNKYNNIKNNINKIRELVSDYQTLN